MECARNVFPCDFMRDERKIQRINGANSTNLLSRHNVTNECLFDTFSMMPMQKLYVSDLTFFRFNILLQKLWTMLFDSRVNLDRVKSIGAFWWWTNWPCEWCLPVAKCMTSAPRELHVSISGANQIELAHHLMTRCPVLLVVLSVVEDLHKKREPLGTMESVYLITPSEESVRCLMRDFENPSRPMYKNAHVYFTEGNYHTLQATIIFLLPFFYYRLSVSLWFYLTHFSVTFFTVKTLVRWISNKLEIKTHTHTSDQTYLAIPENILQLLKGSNARKRMKTCIELNSSFIPYESQVNKFEPAPQAAGSTGFELYR